MAEELRVLPSGKGFESRYGNYNITITLDILEQLKQGKVLHIDVDEYSVILSVGDKVGYEISFGDDSFDAIIQVLMKFGRDCSNEIKTKLSEFVFNLSLGYYGLVQENLDFLYELKEIAKSNTEVIDAIDNILERYSEINDIF